MRKKLLKLFFGSKKRQYALIGFVGVLIIFFGLIKISVLSSATHSIQAGFYAIGNATARLTERVFNSPESLQNQLDSVKAQLAKITLDQARMSGLEARVQELETQLSYQSSVQHKTISARILAKSIEQNNVILIDKGSKQGIRQDLAVVVADGHLVGRISKVRDDVSVVTLIQDPQSKIPVTLSSDNQTSGLVEGEGGYELVMKYIPKTRNIEVGNIIVTSGLDGNIPAGLIVGLVKEIINVDTEPFTQADIEAGVDIRNFTQVLVIDPIPADINL